MKLTDVSRPVSINSLGGNVTIEFDKKKPLSLYSIYTNNGFIDIEIPSNSSVLLDALGRSIYSDIDFNFNISNEVETDKSQEMKLKLNSGKVRMKLDAGHGNIYLRKK